MPRVYVKFSDLKQIGKQCKLISKQIDNVQDDFNRVIRHLDWDVKFEADINRTAKRISRKLQQQEEALKSYKEFIDVAYNVYIKLDEPQKGFFEDYDWTDLLISHWGSIGLIGKLGNDNETGKKWETIAKDIYNIADTGIDLYMDYKDAGRKITDELVEKSIGLDKYDPDIFSKFTGAKGTGKAIGAWAGFAINGILDGVSNYRDNTEEQLLSDGEMSDSRVVAETVTETAVDIGLNLGAKVLVGAIATAVCPVAAPAVLVGIASSFAVDFANEAVRATTGQSVTEWVSDAIIDGADYVVKQVGKSAKPALEPRCSWVITSF